jgi:hypothetical protein
MTRGPGSCSYCYLPLPPAAVLLPAFGFAGFVAPAS